MYLIDNNNVDPITLWKSRAIESVKEQGEKIKMSFSLFKELVGNVVAAAKKIHKLNEKVQQLSS